MVDASSGSSAAPSRSFRHHIFHETESDGFLEQSTLKILLGFPTPYLIVRQSLYLPRSAAALASRAACLSARSTPTSWDESQSAEDSKARTTLLAFQNWMMLITCFPAMTGKVSAPMNCAHETEPMYWNAQTIGPGR